LGFGGAQISTLELLELLTKHGVELKVLICGSGNERLYSHINSLGIKIYQTSCSIVTGYPMMNFENARKVIEWADIVWITDVEYLVAPRIKQLKRVPVVAHLHSYALICPWWSALYGFKETCTKRCSLWRIIRCKQGINLELARIGLLSGGRARLYWFLDFAKGPLDFLRWRKFMSGVLESIDGFIAVSKVMWDIHLKHVPEIKSKPSVVIYNPVTEPLKYIKPDPGEPYDNYVLYASGSNPVKGPHLLLEAWSIVSREFRDLKLYMVGCKNSWVESIAKKMNLRNVVFTKKLPSSEHYYLLYKAKAVAMPSIWPEPFGRIPVEANRLGVPAVVTDRGGLPEIVESNTTSVISKTCREAFTNAIVKVVSQEWDRGKIIESSFKHIDPDKTTNSLLKFFEELLR